jgi:hypothetical protein
LKDEPKPSVADESRIQKYLAGRLDEAEAEAFEERLFADENLAAEVERALEIRAAAAPAAPAVAARPRAAKPPRRAWFALAAAAGAAVLAVGVVWLQRPPPEPVFRGVEQRMDLTVEAGAGTVRARWPAVAGAVGYEVQIFGRDGGLLQTVETREPAATIELPGAAPASIEVTALDDLGQVLQRSERVTL